MFLNILGFCFLDILSSSDPVLHSFLASHFHDYFLDVVIASNYKYSSFPILFAPYLPKQCMLKYSSAQFFDLSCYHIGVMWL
jgi:hypothetical protein